MNKNTLAAIRPKLDAAIGDVLRAHGMLGSLGSISFDPTAGTATCRLSLQTLKTPEEKLDVEKNDFTRYCGLYGFKPDQYRAVFTAGPTKKKYMLVGFNHRAPKNNTRIVYIETGKEYLANSEAVLRKIRKS